MGRGTFRYMGALQTVTVRAAILGEESEKKIDEAGYCANDVVRRIPSPSSVEKYSCKVISR